MPDEEDNEKVEETASTPLHAHAEGREEDIEGDIGGGGSGEGDDQDADDVEPTGGSTSGGPGGHLDEENVPPTPGDSPEQTDHHGEDAADKPEGGALGADNPA